MNQSTQTMTRRQFLVVAGCGCAGLVIAGTGCARVGPVTAAAAAACPYSYRYDPYPGQCYRFIDSNGSGYCDYSEPLITTTTVTTNVSQTGSSAAAAATATATEETRVVLCDRGCRYPGQCGRFVDSDGTGVCDLTEGIVISASTSATTGSAATSSTTGAATATATPTATAAAATTSAATSAATATTAAATATPAATATTAATAVALVVLCDRGCSYPGNCGRYTDNDGTGKCDLSEGIPADQAAAYGGSTRGRSGRGG